MDYDYQSEPCVRSGYCCKKAPCPFGTRDDRGWCEHLVETSKIDDVPIYGCGIYDYIKTQPGWGFCPAFGAGCSSTLFNEDRERVIRAMKTLPVVGGQDG